MVDIGFAWKHNISHVTDIRFARKNNIYALTTNQITEVCNEV